jgi:hypothetical protein
VTLEFSNISTKIIHAVSDIQAWRPLQCLGKVQDSHLFGIYNHTLVHIFV